MDAMIGILNLGGCGTEPFAIRNTLEYFGFRVLLYNVGRPRELVSLMGGNHVPADITYIVICGHGEKGALLLEPLDASLYEPDEPVGPFTPALVRQYGQLSGKTIVLTGCTLGQPETLAAFRNAGAEMAIGPTGYVEGNDALLFTQHFFFCIARGDTPQAAFAHARGLTEETQQFSCVYAVE